MALERLPRRTLEMTIKNRKRQLGRPRSKWIDEIREDLQVREVECTTIMSKEWWEDRDVWRRLSCMIHVKNGRYRRRCKIVCIIHIEFIKTMHYITLNSIT